MTNEIITTNINQARPAAAYLASQRNPATITSDLRKLASLMGFDDWCNVDWASLNAANVAATFAKVEGAPSTRNRALSTLKGVARSAWRLNMLDSETLARINDIKGDSGSREIAGRSVEGWEISALMRACANEAKHNSKAAPKAIRDAAIIGLAVKTGARREELSSIQRVDVTTTQDGYEVKVIGKGNKQRTLYIDGGAAKGLAAWLSITASLPTTAPLFTAISQVGEISEKKLSNMALHKMLDRRMTQAGIEPMGWHDFRRTFAGSLLDAGEDIATVSQLMGHSSVITTARYDRRPAEARRKAARKISVPYVEIH